MKNTLAENMLRFGSKNLDAKSVNKLQKLAEQTGAQTLQQLDPQFQKVEQFFAAAKDRNTDKPAVGSANLMYVARPTTGDKAYAYIIDVYRPQNVKVGDGIYSFIMPMPMGNINFEFASKKLNANNETLQPAALFTQDTANDVKQLAAVINQSWNQIPSSVAIANLQAKKAKFTGTITALKANPYFAELAPMLTNTAKEVYNIIAA
jgi:hypothetical protein